MKLSDFFSTPINKIAENKGQADAGRDAAATERLNRQIKSLTPGKTLQGEVIARNGKEVQIKLSDDLVMTARLDRDVNVEEGKVLTFEVKNNGTSLSLSPLFANTAASDNVLKALGMAGLPVNQTSVSMTELMMQQGMSVDSKSLQAVFKDLTNHPGAVISDVVMLHKMQMPVNDANLGQMESYRQLTHELVRGMTDVLSELPAAFAEVLAKDGPEAAVKMYQAVLQAVTAEFPQMTEGGQTIGNGGETGAQTAGMESAGAQPTETQSAETQPAETQPAGTQSAEIQTTETIMELADTLKGGEVSGTDSGMQNVTGEKATVDGGFLQTAETEDLTVLVKTLADKILQGGDGVEEAFRTLAKLPVNIENGLAAPLKELLESDAFKEALQKFVWKQWSVEPEQGIDKKEVDQVYNRLKLQLDGIKEALMEAGSTQSAAMKSTVSLSQNLDFMNQMNQMYTYVQLPLQMQQGRANGELYVFTNKRSLAKKDGAVSALLHLDMEHLGPVDVYVAMQNEKVNTRFTVQDDAMLLFLNDHMQILTDRLNKKGYDMKCEMSVREPGTEEESPIDRILQTDKSASVLMQYGFDVRA